MNVSAASWTSNARNLAELHRLQAERYGPRPALRYKRHGLYHDLSWQEYREQVLACGAALVEGGIRPGDRVGLLSENCVEWLVADLAIMAAGAVNVPPHAPLSARQVHFQLHDASARWLFVSTQAQLEKVQPILAELPVLQGIVVFEKRGRESFSVRAEKTPDPFFWESFLQQGRRALPRLQAELSQRETALGPDDLATIMYTSGTTGNPKGVMLTHSNLLSNVAAVLASDPPGADDLPLSWLPFSHIYARTMDHYRSVASAAPMALAESQETLVQNLEEIQPTHMNSVPRFYEKVLTAVSSPDPAETARRLRKVYGRRIEFLCSGGAPLPLPVAEAYQAAGLLLLQGYGLTESSPVISFNRKTRHRLNTVGLPLPSVEVRIAPDGEILSRGPHIMKGYWNNPQATAEAIRDGWLHTGDLGSLDADGFLSITGRKKELMVLSNGKKLVPSQIEGLLLGEPCIDQAVVNGEGRNFLTALIVPQWDNLREALQREGTTVDGKVETLCGNQVVCKFLQQRIDATLADVSAWEKVKKFIVLPRPFSVAAEELTVSLKLRRNVVLSKYRAELDALYCD